MTDEDFEVINGVRIPSGFLLLEPREHLDAAICGIEDRVLYDESKLIDAYIDSGMTYEESLEWISYNSDIDGVFYGGTKEYPAPQIKKEEDSYEE